MIAIEDTFHQQRSVFERKSRGLSEQNVTD